MGTGSREENASNQKMRARFAPELAIADQRITCLVDSRVMELDREPL
jgi:hypothetical protein